MRKTFKGRRKVEEAEFCIRCNRLTHEAEVLTLKEQLLEADEHTVLMVEQQNRLAVRVDMLEGYLSEKQLLEVEFRIKHGE